VTPERSVSSPDLGRATAWATQASCAACPLGDSISDDADLPADSFKAAASRAFARAYSGAGQARPDKERRIRFPEGTPMAQVTKLNPHRTAAQLRHWLYPSHRQVALIVRADPLGLPLWVHLPLGLLFHLVLSASA
jgi:hypothetical protein